MTTGIRPAIARSMRAGNLLADHDAHAAADEAGIPSTRPTVTIPSIAPVAMITASFSPVLSTLALRRL